jgi:hypothetical protein
MILNSALTEEKIDVQSISNGIYLLELRNDLGNVIKIRFVKE